MEQQHGAHCVHIADVLPLEDAARRVRADLRRQAQLDLTDIHHAVDNASPETVHALIRQLGWSLERYAADLNALLTAVVGS